MSPVASKYGSTGWTLATSPNLLLTATEAEFQTLVIDYAHLMKWRVAHFRPAQTGKGWRTAMQGDPGFFDLVLARPGHVTLFVELKSEKGQMTPAQWAWVDAVNGDAEIWRPSDWPEIQKTLAR